MHLLEKLKEFVRGFMSISLGVRIIIGTLLGALGSSTAIGFLAELGAVNYAFAYGARLPTEGVPYLRYATTAISLSIFAIAFGVFFILNLTILGAIRQFLIFPSLENLAKDGGLASIPLSTYLLRGAFPALGASQGLFQLFFFAMPVKTLPQWVFPVFALFATVLILTLARKPILAKWLILSTFTIAIGAFFIFAFTPSLYGRALNFSRQGGGVTVRLQMNCENKNPCQPMIAGGLFLRTTESFLLRDEGTQEFLEIPSRLVESVSYVGEERWGTK